MTTKELLEKYNEITLETSKDSAVPGKERALWNLLKANEVYIEGLIENDSTGNWFHKAFRQTDVTDSAYTDMAIWILLLEVELFWKMLDENAE